VRLVGVGAVEREHDAVRQLEDAVHRLARRRFGPLEQAEEHRHPLDIAAGEREEVQLRRQCSTAAAVSGLAFQQICVSGRELRDCKT
jgi:hypothetical protein